jgi:hypothetical protein
MRFTGLIEWNPVKRLEGCWDLEKMHNFESLEEPCNGLINRFKLGLLSTPCLWLVTEFDWSKWVPSSDHPPTCSPRFSFICGVGKKLVTKTWMWEIFLQGRILSVCGDALTPTKVLRGKGCLTSLSRPRPRKLEMQWHLLGGTELAQICHPFSKEKYFCCFTFRKA